MEVLHWWSGSGGGGGAGGDDDGEDGSMKMPCIRGMKFGNAAKTQWTMAVLDEVEPGNSYNPKSSKWQGLRRAMRRTAELLLQELGGYADGGPGVA